MSIKELAADAINRAKNLKEFVVKRDIEDVPLVGTFKYSIRHTHGQPVEITVFALTQEEAEIKVDEWIKEQYDGTH